MDQSRETFLDYLARCNQAFRPFAPINLPEFFKGRTEDILTLRAELAKPGRHVAIYGERGVGKTSLATLAYFYANFSDEETAFVRCERLDDFESIFGQVLERAGVAYLPNGTEANSGTSGGVQLSGTSYSRTKGKKTTFRAVASTRSINPAKLLSVFRERKGLIIIDEFDRVSDGETRTRLAETLKHFSDAAVKTKIIVVGVAETLAELIGEHESITRCLAQIGLGRMNAIELSEIIDTGEARIRVTFKDSVRRKIIGLSDGFPYYTHLIAGYCAEAAGSVLEKNPAARVVVSEPEYEKAIRKAIEHAEGTLRDQYQAAIITVKRKTDMFKHVLWGIAYSNDKEVQVGIIAENIGALTGSQPTTASLNNYLGPLVKPDRKNILTRVRQGFYKFTNPLMRAYVRLTLEDHNLVEQGGQMQFPWMRQD